MLIILYKLYSKNKFMETTSAAASTECVCCEQRGPVDAVNLFLPDICYNNKAHPVYITTADTSLRRRYVTEDGNRRRIWLV